jgi:hypothetical protein
MRSSRRKPNRHADPAKAEAAEITRKAFEAQIQDLAGAFNDVQPELVRDAIHPFEAAGLCRDKPLSIVQKTITYCIQYLGGAASELEILAFFYRHWSQIVAGTDNSKRPVPDKRVLHINFTIQKEQRFLFVRSVHDQQKWCLNTATAPIEPRRRIADRVVMFQDRIVSILQSHEEGLSFEELLELTKEFSNDEGSYQNLPHERRLRTCLTIKKVVREIHFNERFDKWMPGPPRPQRKKGRTEDSIARLHKGICIKDLTGDELWDILKAKGIY